MIAEDDNKDHIDTVAEQIPTIKLWAEFAWQMYSALREVGFDKEPSEKMAETLTDTFVMIQNREVEDEQ